MMRPPHHLLLETKCHLSAEQKQRIVEGALRKVKRRRRMRRGLALCGVLAGILLFGRSFWPETAEITVQQTAFSPATPPSHSSQRTATASATRWSTTDHPRTIRLGDHRLELGQRSQLELRSTDLQRIELYIRQGTVHFSVHTLGPGEQFSVQSPHLSAEVIGTQFTVQVDRECSRLQVEEGRVKVSRLKDPAEMISAGEERRFCTSARDNLTPEEELLHRALQSLLTSDDPQVLIAAERQLAAYLEQLPHGVFAEEALYHLILVKQKRGLPQQARDLTLQFLSRFPRSSRATRLRKGALFR